MVVVMMMMVVVVVMMMMMMMIKIEYVFYGKSFTKVKTYSDLSPGSATLRWELASHHTGPEPVE
jgi:hypothetical protein